MRWHRSERPFPAAGDPSPGAVAGVVTLLTLGTGFALGAVGVPWAWVAFPLGFGGLMPVAVGAAARRRTDGRRWRDLRRDARDEVGDDDVDAALSTLRERYARGDLDEAAFEARLERLLRTEEPDGAREYARSGGHDGTGGRDPTGSRPMGVEAPGERGAR